MITACLAWLALTSPKAAESGPLEYFLDRELKHRQLFFARPDGSHFSDTPACRSGDCQAVVVLEKSRTTPRVKIDIGPGGRNPAGLYCERVAGQARTFYLRSLDEISVCVFADGSIVDSWDLYRAHFTRDRRKKN